MSQISPLLNLGSRRKSSHIIELYVFHCIAACFEFEETHLRLHSPVPALASFSTLPTRLLTNQMRILIILSNQSPIFIILTNQKRREYPRWHSQYRVLTNQRPAHLSSGLRASPRTLIRPVATVANPVVVSPTPGILNCINNIEIVEIFLASFDVET